MYLTGYLTKADSTDISPETKLKIPNAEVMEIFRKNVAEWFTDSVIQSDRRQIFGSITKLMGFRIPHIINSAHINEF